MSVGFRRGAPFASFGGAPVAVPALIMKLLLQSDCGFGAFRRLGSATIVLLAVPVRRETAVGLPNTTLLP